MKITNATNATRHPWNGRGEAQPGESFDTDALKMSGDEIAWHLRRGFKKAKPSKPQPIVEEVVAEIKPSFGRKHKPRR